MNYTEQLKEAQSLIGLYKAEWLNKNLFEYFNEPGYFSSLKTNRPCVLIGGRGTGKTTVLKGLSYEGQYAINSTEKSSTKIKNLEFYGIYYRVNTNRVTAFRGSEISQEKWDKYFGHYINLIFCQELLKFSLWFESVTDEKVLISNTDLRKIVISLQIKRPVESLNELKEEVEILLIEFEASINQAIDNPPENLTAQGGPIDILSEVLTSTEALKDKQFFFLIDEFENFEDYQQKILNTLIKHSNSHYTFKIGVRELGFRERSTLNINEQLTSPADYVRIDLSEIFQPKQFKGFAELVINSRLNYQNFNKEKLDISKILTSMTHMEEAKILLGEKPAFLNDFNKNLSESQKESSVSIELGHKYFIYYWSKKNKETIPNLIEDWFSNREEWNNRLNNHFYASIFAIRAGKTGIRKHYCGWDTFLALSNGNIRYLLELVHTVLQDYLEYKKEKVIENPAIHPDIQTRSAMKIGQKNLSELEGLSVEGAKLKKLLLSLGRVFGILAAEPLKRTPEANQFQVNFNKNNSELSHKILNQAIMHLALIRQPGNKLTGETSIKDYDFMIHPIFSAFFVFSYRRKRKITITEEDLLNLINNPKKGIKSILNENEDSDLSLVLPDQLQLFESYYE